MQAPKYIQDHYIESFNFLLPRKRRQVSQLVLLNNLRRGDANIASTLLITLFNRVMSSLYDDKLQVKFLPSQDINQDQINAYNKLAQSDYLEMGKAKLDYDWCWDALFFGRGYVETLRFDKKRKIMQPHVINPLVFGYDPYFENVQDWRYYWKWITKSKYELQKLIKAGVITGVKRVEEIPSGVDEYLWEYKQKRDAAKETIEPPAESSDADVYQILEYYGYDEDGKKCVYWLDKDLSQVLLKDELDFKDGEETIAPNGQVIESNSKWPIVTKEAFREPHSSVVFSIADLLEDKHRAKSVLLNLAYIAAKDEANPVYLYNPDKVNDVAQFFSRQIMQHIPVSDVVDAVAPLNKASTMSPELLNFISALMTEANDPVGTGMVGQPAQDQGSDTATEAAITQQMNDMAQSLISKVAQFGEQEFWSHWFHRYQRYGKDLGEKMANIVGVKGIDTEKIDLSHFQTNYPPGVMVYSAKEAEYKELVLRRDLMQLYPQLMQSLDPDGMRNFNKYVFLPKFLSDPSLIDIMLPKTLDEMKAEAENEQLKDGEMPQVSETDDHTTHIYMHSMLQPKTWALWFHLSEHEKMLAEQKKQEATMMQQEMQEGGQINVGAEKRSPKAAASPLKSEINSNNKPSK